MSKFNPINWPPERQVALGLGPLIGAAIGGIVAYSLNPSSGFAFFLTHPTYFDAWGLYFTGAAIGLAVVYTFCLVSKS